MRGEGVGPAAAPAAGCSPRPRVAGRVFRLRPQEKGGGVGSEAARPVYTGGLLAGEGVLKCLHQGRRTAVSLSRGVCYSLPGQKYNIF